MTSLTQMFATDANSETDGILINFGDTRFQIARAGGSNTKFRRLFQAKIKPYRHQIDNEALDDEIGERLLAEVYAETVILGWETKKRDKDGNEVLDAKGDPKWVSKLDVGDGKLLDFTVDNCVKVLTELPELFSTIQKYAAAAANFRKEEDAADEKNSETS